MRRIIFIVPFYGKKPAYFDLWVKSIEHNPKIDFLFVSDLDLGESFPPNFHILKMSFDELKEKIQSKFDFKISIETPYNLCDFKPAYGDIFEEYIKEYGFWGNCDTDQIFGNVLGFLNEDIFGKYDRILYLGHFSLYKNSEKMKGFYKLPGALYDYKTVFSRKEWFSFGEITGTLQISLKNDISIYSRIIYVDTISAYSQLKFYGDTVEPKHFVFYWEDGRLFRAYLLDNKIYCDEWMYIHLQKRKMEEKVSKSSKAFFIRGREFIDKEKMGVPSIEDILKLSDYKGEKETKRERKRYVRKQLAKFFKKPFKEKKIWLKQRLARNKLLWPDNPLYR